MKYRRQMNEIDIAKTSAALSGSPGTLIELDERKFRGELEKIGAMAISGHRHLILITGPSSSGKTTTAKRIADILTAYEKKAVRISLDNFYRPVGEMPLWDDGYQNYESVECLDLNLFDRVMHELLESGHTMLPHFNFLSGDRDDSVIPLSYDESTYLILEGIHALNPELTDVLDGYETLRVYISTHSNFFDYNNVVLTARDLRLARRIMRDYLYRGTSAMETLEMWRYVLRGEDLYIRPFRQYADVHIDSTHSYEPYLYHNSLLSLIETIGRDSRDFDYVKRLINARDYFFPIDESLIPQTSLIQEFIRHDYQLDRP